MTDRDCNKCLWATRDGSCAAWNCEFVPKSVAYKAWKEASVNEPLSWDDLSQMKGKPVWIEFLKEDKKRWTLVFSVGKFMDGKWVFADNDDFYTEEELGTRWNAYRNERK